MLDQYRWILGNVLERLAARRVIGQGLTEYGLILVFVAVIVIVALGFFGSHTNALLGRASASLS